MCASRSIVFVSLIATCLLLAVSSVKADSCLATLFVNDPFQNALSFNMSLSASVQNAGILKNHQTDIVFSKATELSVVPEGSRTASVVYIGTESSLKVEYKTSNLAFGTIYSSIHYVGDQLVLYSSADQNTQTFQPFSNSTTIALEDMKQKQAIKSAAAGQIYLLKLSAQSRSDSEYAIVVKLFVVAVSSTQVTIRWDVIQGQSDDTRCGYNLNQPVYIEALGYASNTIPCNCDISNNNNNNNNNDNNNHNNDNNNNNDDDDIKWGLVIVCAVSLIAIIVSTAAIVLVLVMKRELSRGYVELNQ